MAEFVDPTENPAFANAKINELLQDDRQPPAIGDPPDTEVQLPGGYLTRAGELITTAEVKELTGEDEEALARAKDSARFMAILLERGTVRLGDEKASTSLLKELLIGDRDALILGIRKATFGNELELHEVVCPHCLGTVDLTITLDDIPVRKLEEPSLRTFEVQLRHGKAKVHLADGYIQEKLFENAKLSVAERNTLLLSECVTHLPDDSGVSRPVVGTGPVQRLGMQDRRTLLDFLDEKQPGPQYDKLSFTHEDCGKESPIALSLGDLFR